MKCMLCLLLAVAATTMAVAQQETPDRVGTGATSLSESGNLPVERVGPNDLLGITVYDSPELTRSVRVEQGGIIRLPMVQQPIQVAGLYPAQLEKVITKALVENNVLVEPIVTVSVLEYRSRPITVAGAVRTPSTFQADGTITLLDAISRAGGLADNAGPEILVTHQPSDASDDPAPLTERILARSLIDNGADPALNIALQGGEIIRVPEAGRIYVVGDVKNQGSFLITNGPASSVLKALAFSEGLDSYAAHTAYIFRTEGGISTSRNEIPVDLRGILDRKSPDVPLIANDMLYVPNSRSKKIGAKTAEILLGTGVAVAGLLLYLAR